MFTVDFGKTTTSMEKASINLPTVTITKATFTREQGTVRDAICGAIRAVTKVTGNLIRCMDMESTLLLRGQSPKDGFRMTSLWDEPINLPIVIFLFLSF
jgi:hypothetical protein